MNNSTSPCFLVTLQPQFHAGRRAAVLPSFLKYFVPDPKPSAVAEKTARAIDFGAEPIFF
jgi:hypothetical protein